jgi:cytochrome P450/ferredoxin
MPDGSLAWLVTRYDDVKAVLSDNRFSTDPASPGYPFLSPARAAQLQSEKPKAFIRMDPPEHTRFRRMLTKDFMVANIEAMRPMIEQTVHSLIDDLESKGPPCDFFKDFALALPTTIISNILGVPHKDREYFQERSKTKLDLSVAPAVSIKATQEMRAFLDKLYGEKLENASDGRDLISRLITTQVIPGHMTREEAVAMIDLVLIAGHETTSNMITLGTLSLLMQPEQRDQIVANPALVKNAVEEMLRFHTILQFKGERVALDDVEIGGQLIRKGEGVLALISAANRDPAAFPDPDKFDIHREVRHHVAFGFGVHQCLGQPLGRVELQSVFSILFQRLPTLKLAVPIEALNFNSAAAVYGLHSLPVTWAAAEASPAIKKFFTVDVSKCVGGGQCVMAAPTVFAQNEEDGLVKVINENPSPEEHEAVREAARLCPALCIHVAE